MLVLKAQSLCRLENLRIDMESDQRLVCGCGYRHIIFHTMAEHLGEGANGTRRVRDKYFSVAGLDF